MDFSDTWCPPCGAYGVDVADTLVAHIATDDIGYLINIKGSSTPASLNAVGSNALSSNYEITGIPTFAINDPSNHDGVSGNNSGDVTRIKNKINTANASIGEGSI